MKIFEHPNMNNFCCSICGTADDKPVTLIGIRGTEEGNNMQARQYHVSCIELLETSVGGQRILAQVVPDQGEREDETGSRTATTENDTHGAARTTSDP